MRNSKLLQPSWAAPSSDVGGAGDSPGRSAELRDLLVRCVDHLGDAVLITEGENVEPGAPRRIIFVNRTFVEITGFSPEEAIGKTPDITMGPLSDRAVVQKIAEARAQRRSIRVEILKYRKDRSTFWAELDVIPYTAADGRVTHWLGVLRDVTERKALQARLRETDRLATIGTLAAGLAHEINNPIAYTLMNLEMLPRLLRSGLPPDARATLERAHEGAAQVHAIVHNIRAFSRQEPAAAAVPVDVQAVLDGAIQMVDAPLRPRAWLDRSYEPVPPVLANTARLAQVFLNVLVNAVEAIPEGRPQDHRITVRLRAARAVVCVEVTDTGSGIDPDILAHIFDPFFTTKAQGTGLGLSICHGIVSDYGGTITVESAPGGTTVRIELPAMETG